MTCETMHHTCPGSLQASGRLSVRGALGYLARSAMELHRYRYLRARILQGSIATFDRRKDCS